MGRVEPAPRGVVGEEERPRVEPLEVAQPLLGLVFGVADDRPVVGQFEGLDLVALRGRGEHHHGAVLGTGDVHLQPGEEQHLLEGVARPDDVGVGEVDAELVVGRAAVVGDHHPVEAVVVRLGDLPLHRIFGVGAVARVDMMVAGEEEVAVELVRALGAVGAHPQRPTGARVGGEGAARRDTSPGDQQPGGADPTEHLPAGDVAAPRMGPRLGEVALVVRAIGAAMVPVVVVMVVAMARPVGPAHRSASLSRSPSHRRSGRRRHLSRYSVGAPG